MNCLSLLILIYFEQPFALHLNPAGNTYRKPWVTHEPRCSRIGPSLTFAIIAAPNRSTKNINTTKSRQFQAMLSSLLRV